MASNRPEINHKEFSAVVFKVHQEIQALRPGSPLKVIRSFVGRLAERVSLSVISIDTSQSYPNFGNEVGKFFKLPDGERKFLRNGFTNQVNALLLDEKVKLSSFLSDPQIDVLKYNTAYFANKTQADLLESARIKAKRSGEDPQVCRDWLETAKKLGEILGDQLWQPSINYGDVYNSIENGVRRIEEMRPIEQKRA